MKIASIKIVFYGPLSSKAGINELVIEVGADFADAIDNVKKEVIKRVGDKMNFTILVNGVSSNTIDQNEYVVKDGDEYVVLMIMSGG